MGIIKDQISWAPNKLKYLDNMVYDDWIHS